MRLVMSFSKNQINSFLNRLFIGLSVVSYEELITIIASNYAVVITINNFQVHIPRPSWLSSWSIDSDQSCVNYTSMDFFDSSLEHLEYAQEDPLLFFV